MTWVTNKIALDSALKSLKLKQNPQNKTLEESWLDRGYTVTVTIESEELTNTALQTLDMVRLEVGYQVKDNKDYDVSVDSFRSVLEAIKKINPAFQGFTSNAEHRRLDEDIYKIIWSIEFYYGSKTCN